MGRFLGRALDQPEFGPVCRASSRARPQNSSPDPPKHRARLPRPDVKSGPGRAQVRRPNDDLNIEELVDDDDDDGGGIGGNRSEVGGGGIFTNEDRGFGDHMSMAYDMAGAMTRVVGEPGDGPSSN
ncbi:forkhead box protein O3B-like [Tripterygium wilfordii]|uniref:forkhead box protein O3B-like n=1 Tax=Tripterygium wilfordii TaxID=458696 RepID=UPI0018F83DB0|nr:forkhead box protein O3B-like [Tripterygium wilfordii]